MKKAQGSFKVVAVFLALVVLVLAGVLVWHLDDRKAAQSQQEAKAALVPRGIASPAISFNNVTLQDSTVIDAATNTCTATRLGMTIVISPCVSQDVDGTDIEQYVNFTWNGAQPKNISWIFVYEGMLRGGSMGLWRNVSFINRQTQLLNQPITNFLVTSISNFTNMGTPDSRCEMGSANNTQMYNVTRNNNQTVYSQIYCFTTATAVNSTAYRLSGNRDVPTEVNVTTSRMAWDDVTNQVSFLGVGLLNDNRSYYRVQNVPFAVGQTYSTHWMYSALNASRKGKWHILGFDSDVGLVQSIVNGQYIYVDPWWDNAWSYKKAVTLANNITFANTTVTLGFARPSSMNSGYTDLRVVNSSETGELPYCIENATTNDINVTVRLLTNATFYIYYGNAGASTNVSNCTQVYTGSISNITQALDSSASDSGYKGFQFSPNTSVTVVKFYTTTSSLTNAKLQDNSNADLAVSSVPATVGSLIAYTFRYPAESGVLYRLVADENPMKYKVPVAGYTNSPLLTLTNQIYAGSVDNGGYRTGWGIEAVSRYNQTYTIGSETANSGLSVAFNYPATAYGFGTSTVNVSGNATGAGGTGVSNLTVSVSNLTSGLLVWRNVTATSGNNVSIRWINSTFVDGNYTWYFNAYGNDGTSANSTNRTFYVDTTNPSIAVNTPTAAQTFPVSSFPANVSLNFTTSDIYLQACWYSTSDSATNVTVNCNTQNNVSFSADGNKTIYVFANDSTGHTANASVPFLLRGFSAWAFPDSTAASVGGQTNITLAINMTDIPSTAAYLTYNHTNYAPTSSGSTQNRSVFNVVFTIPNGYGNSTGIAQDWNWTYNITGFAINNKTVNQQQTVYSILLSDCTGSGTLVYNFTHRDENSRNITNYTNGNNLQVDLVITSLFDSTQKVLYNTTKLNSPSLPVCISNGALNTTNYRVDLTGSYVGTGYVQEFFYITNGTLSLNNSPQNYDWYDLPTTDSTTFLFSYEDENGLTPAEIVVNTLRYYIGYGTYTEVERSKEDNNGETLMHLVEEDVIYRFNVTQGNKQIFLSDPYTAKCLQTPCSISLSAQQGTTQLLPSTAWGNLPEGSYSLSTNKTARVVTLLFNMNSSALMNLSVYSDDGLNETQIGSSSTTASGGTLTVNVPVTYGNYTFFAVIWRNNNVVTSQWVDLKEDAQTYFGAMGLLLGLFAIIFISLMGASQGEFVFLWFIFGVIVVVMMSLVDMPIYAIMTLISLAGLLIWKLATRRRIS